MAQSPVSRWMVRSNSLDCAVQRTSSPASAEMSALAESIFFCVAAASSSSACFCAMAWSNCACISSSLACTVAMRSSAAFFSLVATLSSASASRSVAILGSTTLATLWYVHIDSAQLQRPATLPLASGGGRFRARTHACVREGERGAAAGACACALVRGGEHADAAGRPHRGQAFGLSGGKERTPRGRGGGTGLKGGHANRLVATCQSWSSTARTRRTLPEASPPPHPAFLTSPLPPHPASLTRPPPPPPAYLTSPPALTPGAHSLFAAS
eukprot:54229-Chlamydomonas_euryale.AAC.9